MSWYDNEWGYANQMVREALSAVLGSRANKPVNRIQWAPKNEFITATRSPIFTHSDLGDTGK